MSLNYQEVFENSDIKHIADNIKNYLVNEKKPNAHMSGASYDLVSKIMKVKVNNDNIINFTDISKCPDKICKNKHRYFNFNGFWWECADCHARFPNDKNEVIGINEEYKQLWINNGIVINNLNINEKPLTLYDTLLDYPLNFEIMNEENLYRKFRQMVQTHNLFDIITFIKKYKVGIKYTLFLNGKVYKSNTNIEVDKNEFIDDIMKSTMDIIDKYINYYNDNEITINEINKNKELKMNLVELKRFIENKYKSDILPEIFKYISKEADNPYNIIRFFEKFNKRPDFYIKVDTLYSYYEEWHNENKIETTVILLKDELKKLADEYFIKKFDIKYKRYSVCNKPTRCWKNIFYLK